jgi:2-dehydropantoate 2-reductase
MRAIEVGKIAVVGSGAIGLYYGGKLAAREANVHFLMRSGFDEGRQRGISIYSVQGEDIRLEHPKISRDVCEIGPCDLVIVALKTTSNSSLEKLLPPPPQRDHVADASKRPRQRGVSG